MDFNDLLKIMKLFKAKKKLTSKIQVEKKSHGVKELMKKYNYKTCINFASSYLIELPFITIYQSFHFPVATFIQTSGTNYQPMDKKIDHFTEIIKRSIFSIQILQNNTDLFTIKNNFNSMFF